MKRRTLAQSSILILLLSVLAGTSFVSLAGANPRPRPYMIQIYIRSDGTVDPSTAPIQRAGNVYTFTSDLINSTVMVQRDNIVIDGAGFRLQGEGVEWWNTEVGITLTNRSNVVIKNIDIRNYVHSISLTASSNIIIYGNNMLTGWNMLLDSSADNQIVGNNITAQSSYYCIQIGGGSSNNLIMGNNFYDASSAVTVYKGSVNNTFHHNNFFNNSYNVVDWSGYEEDNFWDNGTEGNFWSDYEGFDGNGDGVGDTPYTMSSYLIDDYPQDLHPLMTPFNVSSVTMELPEWESPSPSQEDQSTPKPFPTALIAVSITIIVAIGIGLLLYFKKRKNSKITEKTE